MTELFSSLIIWYLFLGGLGGGAYLVAWTLGILAARKGGPWALLHARVRMPLLVASLGSLVAGALCLFKDLAREEQALLLFSKPTLTPISVGTFTLSALIACATVLVVLGVRNPIGTESPAQRLVAAVGAAAALVVVAYTGVLLSSMPSVPLWTSPALPALFALSALSCGVAAALAVAAFAEPDLERLRPALSKLMRADTALIALEIVAAVLLCFHARNSPAAAASLAALASGPLAAQFWIGFVLCGLAIPAIMESVPARSASAHRGWCIVASCSVLAGGFFLRLCTVAAGAHLSLFMFA